LANASMYAMSQFQEPQQYAPNQAQTQPQQWQDSSQNNFAYQPEPAAPWGQPAHVQQFPPPMPQQELQTMPISGQGQRQRQDPIVASLSPDVKSPPKQGMQVIVKDLSYSVQIPLQQDGAPSGPRPCLKSKGGETQTKTIIYPMSAEFKPGRLTAIMGPSGAGKTSMLNVISGSGQEGAVEGALIINGQNTNGATMRKLSAFVFQDDVILETMTVREAIMMSAVLRLPQTLSLAQKTAKVDEIIHTLHLELAADTVIGGVTTGVTGISGGERKRTAVAMELVTNPSIIFLDEPTSGLDTFTAFSLIRTLKSLASKGRTVIATIHQPSSDIYHLFDDLLLLSRGHVVYNGPVANAVGYFAERGFPCDQFTNPADHFFMRVLNNTAEIDTDALEGEELRVALALGRKQLDARLDGLVHAWAEHPYAEQVRRDVASPFVIGYDKSDFKTEASWTRQFATLWKRAFKNAVRNKMVVRAKLAQTLFLACLIGLIYLQVDDSQASIQDRTGVLFFIAINQVMGSAIAILSIFHGEKTVFAREHKSGMYGLSAYFFSRTLVELPHGVIFPFIGATIMYWMIGLRHDAGRYFITCVIVIFLSNCGNSIGILGACATPNLSIALGVVPMALLPLMLFSGLFANLDSIPVFIRWLKWITPMKYGFVALAKNEFEDLPFVCTASELVKTPKGEMNCPVTNGNQVIRAFGMEDELSVVENMLILLGIWGVCLILAYLALLRTASSRSRSASMIGQHVVTSNAASALPSPAHDQNSQHAGGHLP